MAKIIDLEQEKLKRIANQDTLIRFLESEVKKQGNNLGLKVNQLGKEILGLMIVRKNGLIKKEVLKFNLDYTIDDTKIDSIEVINQQYICAAKNIAEKYEKSYGKEEVKIYING